MFGIFAKSFMTATRIEDRPQRGAESRDLPRLRTPEGTRPMRRGA
ncbi:hypothetical protein [Pseudoponticoccus marisrubri]|nr:hypothetical protein [Pseudoponticoccus marisrubri]